MKSNIFIPKRINVGFQERSDTYTKKLAYIIYFDEKGTLRKEKSWNSWRDSKIDNIIYDNVPISGFVLNKKVGDYSNGWNHRQSYIRVYDSRNYEFEITMENLLYILENANSIKGKGLEGEFIYGWDGKDLILIPTCSPDYIEISKFNEILHSNSHIKAKELIVGATYKTKQNEEWIYMGRFDYWTTKSERIEIPNKNNWYDSSYDYIYKNVNKGKHHYFARECKYSWDNSNNVYLSTLKLKSLGDKFIEIISEDCIENYADLFDKLERTIDYSPRDKTKDEYVRYNFDEFSKKIVNNYLYCYNSQKKETIVRKYYNSIDKYYCEDRKNNEYKTNKVEGTVEEIYNILQPMYKNEYLQNGKLYKEGK